MSGLSLIHIFLHILDHGAERQYFYLARAQAWSAKPGDRSGPEFADPERGEYRLQPIHLTVPALMAISLKPDPFAGFLPVSYTHLDVYKRQRRCISLRRPSRLRGLSVA